MSDDPDIRAFLMNRVLLGADEVTLDEVPFRREPPVGPNAATLQQVTSSKHGNLPTLAEYCRSLDSLCNMKADKLQEIRDCIRDCTQCPLCKSRTHIVFGEGNPDAQLVFVGEGPGADEDKQGRPFVGRAGRLLDKMIVAMDLKRKDVYISNVVKCRPPQNRDPERLEMDTCFPFLENQIEVIKPKAIVSLGRIATQRLLETKEPLSRLRGRFHERQGINIMATYHPSYLLRAEPDRQPKADAWGDLQKVMALLKNEK